MIMTDVEAVLTAWLEVQAGIAFEWGVSDCTLFPADWLRLWGPDPAKSWRGRYGSALGAARLIRQAGGYQSLCRGVLGAPCTRRAPLPGDAGILPARDDRRALEIGGICLGGGEWVSRADSGLLMGRAEPILFWSLTDYASGDCLRSG